MALKITEECIDCGACEDKCPNGAIYQGSTRWTFARGTTVRGMVTLLDGYQVDAEEENPPYASEYPYIVPDKCTECNGFYEEMQCVSVCPVGCCIHDFNYVETKEQLLEKKNKLHNYIESSKISEKMQR